MMLEEQAGGGGEDGCLHHMEHGCFHRKHDTHYANLMIDDPMSSLIDV